MAKNKPKQTKQDEPKRSGDRAAKDSAAAKKKLSALEEKIAGLLGQHMDQAVKLAADEKAKSKLLRRLRDPQHLQKLTRKQNSSVPTETLQAIFQQLASAIEAGGQPQRVAFLGPLHSYSHLATLERFGAAAELVPVRTIAAVFEEVSSGQADAGVVPIENSTDGRIVDTLEMLTRASVRICGEIPLPIHHCLLGTGSRTDIQQVCSKPQAISQCRAWLAHHLPDAKIVSVSSTTAAAEMAAKDSSVAAIASVQAGVQYGLRVLAENIEDNQENVTRFAVIGPEPAKRTGHDKTSLMFELPHEPGALADAMMIFKKNRLNLTWIESFPKPGSPNEYFFFVELVGYQTDLRVRRAITALEKKCVRIEVLGSYEQANVR